MSEVCDIGVVGLGVMGANLARNLAGRGHRVSGSTLRLEDAEGLVAAHPQLPLVAAESLEAMVRGLARPRRILIMVPAGAPVDAVLDDLDPLLQDGDVVVDGGNSLYRDSDRRGERATARPWHFVGMGVSGGAQGALEGPSLMPGGDVAAWERLRPLLESIAAVSESGPCVAHCGLGSAGHFVKMVHNGIEYGDMQLIAETAWLLRFGLGLGAEAVADCFEAWNASELESYLIEISAAIFRRADPERPEQPGRLLLDAILDRAGQKGTGRWTVGASLELAVAIPTIAAAVDARVLSAAGALRERVAAAFSEAGPHEARLEGVREQDLHDALWCSKLASYAQGFSLLAEASRVHGYGTDLAEVARIWKAGCIIRARLLDPVREALREDPERPLVLAPSLRAEWIARLPGWRRSVAAALSAGHPIPGMAASLGWFDTLGRARSNASLIQAQRDFFGNHGYERVDAPGRAIHSDWSLPGSGRRGGREGLRG